MLLNWPLTRPPPIWLRRTYPKGSVSLDSQTSGRMPKGKRLYGQARRLLIRPCVFYAEYAPSAPYESSSFATPPAGALWTLDIVPLMTQKEDVERLILPLNREEKSCEAAYKTSLPAGQSTTLSPAGAVKLKNPPAVRPVHFKNLSPWSEAPPLININIFPRFHSPKVV